MIKVVQFVKVAFLPWRIHPVIEGLSVALPRELSVQNSKGLLRALWFAAKEVLIQRNKHQIGMLQTHGVKFHASEWRHDLKRGKSTIDHKPKPLNTKSTTLSCRQPGRLSSEELHVSRKRERATRLGLYVALQALEDALHCRRLSRPWEAADVWNQQ